MDKHDPLILNFENIPEKELRLLHAFLEELDQDVAFAIAEKATQEKKPEKRLMDDSDFLNLLMSYFKNIPDEDSLKYNAIERLQPFYGQLPRSEIEQSICDKAMTLRISNQQKAQVIIFIKTHIASREVSDQEPSQSAEALAGSKKRFAGGLISTRRAWYDEHIPDGNAREVVARREMDYAMGLRGLDIGEFSMDPALHMKTVFDRLRLHQAYAQAGLTEDQVGEAFANLHAIKNKLAPGTNQRAQ